jgi:hypothetical protein
VCKIQKVLGNFAIFYENGADLRLAEQINNRIRILAGFDLGTKSNKKKEQKNVILGIPNPQFSAAIP